jgi:hypothetical protein
VHSTSKNFPGLELSHIKQRIFFLPGDISIMSSNIKDTVVNTAKEDADRVKHLTRDAAKSGAYLYPFKATAHTQ